MTKEINLEEYVNLTDAPIEEPARQYYYMAQCRAYVQELAKELGHMPTCCVTTFGCPMVIVTQKCGNPLFI